MSTLQNALSQRRVEASTEDTPLCFAVATSASSVTFTTWKSGIWVLPWIHFLAAHHVTHAKGERIEFTFAHHAVVAEGLRLVLLVPEIATARLSALRELPERFSADMPLAEPCVLRLLITLRMEIGSIHPEK
jgi:hypothetical protein